MKCSNFFPSNGKSLKEKNVLSNIFEFLKSRLIFISFLYFFNANIYNYKLYIFKNYHIKLACISLNSFSENKAQKSVVETYKLVSSAAD